MSKQQVQELNINGVPSSLNLTNIGAYINNGTTNIEIKKYIDDKVKSASGNGGGGGTVVEGGYPKLIVLGDTTRTPLEESVEAYNYFRSTPSDQWDGRYIVAIGAKESGLCYPYKIKIADSDKIRVYAIKTTDNFPTTYVEYFWKADGKLTNYATKTYLSESNYKNYISGGSTGGNGSKLIVVNDENFNTVEERREAYEYIRSLNNENKFDGRYTFVLLESDDEGEVNQYSMFIKFFPATYEDAVYFYRAHCTPGGEGGFQIHKWSPNYPEEGKYLSEWVGGRDPLYEGARQTYSIHNWGMYDDNSTWAPINYNRDFYEIVNPGRFTHMGKVWEKQIPYEENHLPTREDLENNSDTAYNSVWDIEHWLFNPTYGLIGNHLSYGRLVAYEPSAQWRIIKYEYEWCKVKLYRAFVEDNILKIQFAAVNLDDSDDYSWGGLYELEGWKERWGFTQLEDQEITLEPYRLTMSNVNTVYPKENAFYVYK
jgi:hypothetical protein